MASEIDTMFVTSDKDLVSVFEETGNIGLDMALTNGKGVEIGSYVILTAGNGAGKSTTCLDLVKRNDKGLLSKPILCFAPESTHIKPAEKKRCTHRTTS